MTTALAVQPLKMSGSHKEREARGQQLAKVFIHEMVPLLVQVRQDFLDKERDETICGVKTFTEYCTGILRYSEVHIRRLIAGHNPASEKFDGSENRKQLPDATPGAEPPRDYLAEETEETATEQTRLAGLFKTPVTVRWIGGDRKPFFTVQLKFDTARDVEMFAAKVNR